MTRLDYIAVRKYCSLIRTFVHPWNRFVSTSIEGAIEGAVILLRIWSSSIQLDGEYLLEDREKSLSGLQYGVSSRASQFIAPENVGSEGEFPVVYHAYTTDAV